MTIAQRQIGEFCSIKHGFAFKSRNFEASGTHIVLTPGNFDEAGGFRDTPHSKKFYGGEIPAEYILNRGDLILVMTEQKEGLLGSAAFVPADQRYLHNQRLGLITGLAESEVDPRFLYHVLNSTPVRRQISLTAAGTKVRHTSPSKILAVSFFHFPIEEQRKIAEILSTWDRAIELTEKLIAARQKRKQALMQQLLTGEVRLPKFRRRKWKRYRLGDVAENSSRRAGDQGTRDLVYSVTNSVGMVPMDPGTIGESVERYKLVQQQDFAYNPMRINVGSISMWEESRDVFVSPDYVVFRCGDALDPGFLNQFRRRHYVNRAGGGSVRVRIYFKDLAPMQLKLPDIEEQRAISRILNCQDRELDLLHRRVDILKLQKKGLMQQLLTGKTRVNVEEAVADE